MPLLDELTSQLRFDEGFRQLAYKDTTGNVTVGYGRNLTSVGIDEIEASYLLRNDIIRTLAALSSLPWFQSLSTVRQVVVANMAFNMGIAKLLGFKNMLHAIQVKDYDDAAVEMLNSEWATQVGQRAVRLARKMKDGI